MLAEYHGNEAFNTLFIGDFYSNLIREAGLTASREEVKELFLIFLNSGESKRVGFKGELPKLASYFAREFSEIAAFIAEKNRDGEFLGGFLAREYEAPVMYELQTLIKSDPLLAPLKSVIIYDGIELWGEKVTCNMRKRVSELCSIALSSYRYLRVKNKEFNPLAA
jgi:predicted AlkP superfamily pyrophosphatase or phosphodiesterase